MARHHREVLKGDLVFCCFVGGLVVCVLVTNTDVIIARGMVRIPTVEEKFSNVIDCKSTEPQQFFSVF